MQLGAFLKSNIAWVGSAVLVAGVLAGTLVAIVLTMQPKPQGDTPKKTATCVLVDYTMSKPIKIRCNVSAPAEKDAGAPAEKDAGIDVSRTSFSLNGGDVLTVNCSYQAMDGVIKCQGPPVTCQIRGTLSIAFFDNAGNDVLDKTLINLGSPSYSVVTSVLQVLGPINKTLTSHFNFTCGVKSSCDTFTMALYVGGNSLLTEEDATLCINTSAPDAGFNKSCVFEVDEEVIRQQRSMDISCALLHNGVVAKQQKFLLPMCSDRSSDCNCSAKTTSCAEICTKVETCLKHDASTRYEKIFTEDPALKRFCPVLCTPKWCRDTFNDDKTETVTPEILQAMCKNS